MKEMICPFCAYFAFTSNFICPFCLLPMISEEDYLKQSNEEPKEQNEENL